MIGGVVDHKTATYTMVEDKEPKHSIAVARLKGGRDHKQHKVTNKAAKRTEQSNISV